MTMSTKSNELAVTRRTVLRGSAAAVTAGVGVGAATPATAQSAAESDFDGWFENTSNYDGVVDKTGADSVTIAVGASGNGGNLAFDPPAVHVDPGTRVVWEWTGQGSVHNVVAENGAFESEMADEEGFTFEYTVQEEGVIKYACGPHKPMGMRGVLVVGNAGNGVGSGSESASQPTEPDFGGWFDNTGNYEQTVDATGRDSVTVSVGASGNNGNLAFDPPAIRVDPGTTITWEWTGKGSTHNVVAENGAFESELHKEAGATFEQTVENPGTLRYSCAPHKPMGMKGAIVVGGAQASTDSNAGISDLLTIGGGLGLTGTLIAMFAYGARSKTRDQ